MKKAVILATAGALAAGSMALLTVGPASADGPMNVVGQPYGKARAILKSQGYRVQFYGSFGSDLPQDQCAVDTMKMNKSGLVMLSLDCTLPEGVERAPGGTPKINAGVPVIRPPLTPLPGAPSSPAPVPPPPPG